MKVKVPNVQGLKVDLLSQFYCSQSTKWNWTICPRESTDETLLLVTPDRLWCLASIIETTTLPNQSLHSLPHVHIVSTAATTRENCEVQTLPRLKERDVPRLGKFVSLVSCHLSFCSQVCLVSNQNWDRCQLSTWAGYLWEPHQHLSPWESVLWNYRLLRRNVWKWWRTWWQTHAKSSCTDVSSQCTLSLSFKVTLR